MLWQADSDPAARAVLAEHWPGVHRYTDVREIDARAQRPDIICGGFPCQDISDAGTNHRRRGLDGPRSGLWTEFRRVVATLHPSFVFIENVAALTERGLDRILRDLAALGFDAEWGCFTACEAGAPHTRQRLFLLAHANSESESASALDAQVARVPPIARPLWDGRSPPAGALGVADGVPGELDRLRLGGNAVIPCQAEVAFRSLQRWFAP